MNFKKEYGLTKKQAQILVAALRYFRWWSLQENQKEAESKIWKLAKRGHMVGFYGNVPPRFYLKDRVLGKHLMLFWSELRMSPCANIWNPTGILRNLERKGFIKADFNLYENNRYFKFSQEGIIVATHLELSMIETGEAWEFPRVS